MNEQIKEMIGEIIIKNAQEMLGNLGYSCAPVGGRYEGIGDNFITINYGVIPEKTGEWESITERYSNGWGMSAYKDAGGVILVSKYHGVNGSNSIAYFQTETPPEA